MAGSLTETGYQYPNLQETITLIEKDFQDIFNNPLISAEDNENMGNIIKIMAGRENLVDQAISQVWNGWTRAGLEGNFMDEAFALNGIFREAATAGSGFAVVETNDSAIDSTPIVAGTLFNGTNGVVYSAPNAAVVGQRVTAYRLDATSVSLGSYTFNVTNRVTDELFTDTFTLASTSTIARETFLDEIFTFLGTVNPSETNIYKDVPNLTLYYGFDEAFELTGLEETTDILLSPSIGNRYTLVEAVGTTTGFNPLRIGEITSMSILPTGYVSVTNLTAFSSGSDIETDAAFFERAESQIDSPRSSTRPAIISGLLRNVEGIDKIRFIKEVNSGIVTVEPVIIGGENTDIAEELYRTQPINNIYSGDIAVDVATEDDEIETIRFSRGVAQNLSIRITYITELGTALTETEKDGTTTNLLDLSEGWQLGGIIFNAQLMSAVFSAAGNDRFTSLIVETKKKEEPDTSYTTANYQPLPNELPVLDAVDILFVQQII